MSILYKIIDCLICNECLRCKNSIKGSFIIASSKSPKSSRTTTFRLVFRQAFFTGVNTFWIEQSNKPVIDAINKLNKRRKATSISNFDFSTLYTKLPHGKRLMVLNSLID